MVCFSKCSELEERSLEVNDWVLIENGWNACVIGSSIVDKRLEFTEIAVEYDPVFRPMVHRSCIIH